MALLPSNNSKVKAANIVIVVTPAISEAFNVYFHIPRIYKCPPGCQYSNEQRTANNADRKKEHHCPACDNISRLIGRT